MAGSRYPNIDSGTRRNEYIGYGAGTWRIVRWGPARSPNAWRAVCVRGDQRGGVLLGPTLGDLSAQLTKLAAAQAALPQPTPDH